MSDTAAGLLQVALLVAVLVVVYKPLGDYMARVYTAKTHLRAERVIYRLVRVVRPAGHQHVRLGRDYLLDVDLLIGCVLRDRPGVDPVQHLLAADERGVRDAGQDVYLA